jgi:hypothetical protein
MQVLLFLVAQSLASLSPKLVNSEAKLPSFLGRLDSHGWFRHPITHLFHSSPQQKPSPSKHLLSFKLTFWIELETVRESVPCPESCSEHASHGTFVPESEIRAVIITRLGSCYRGIWRDMSPGLFSPLQLCSLYSILLCRLSPSNFSGLCGVIFSRCFSNLFSCRWRCWAWCLQWIWRACLVWTCRNHQRACLAWTCQSRQVLHQLQR